MKFNFFPKKQELFLVYSSYRTFRSRLFYNLITQSSPKNSIFFRFLKTDIGFRMSSFFKYEIKVPKDNTEYVGIIKGNKKILFEMKNNNPIWVWRKKGNDTWAKESFLGYQLISEYTLKEFDSKYHLIESALKIHWDSINKTPTKIHGDFTHFNILYDKNGNIHFIDRKCHENSKLFDFFYFYAYLKQSIFRCSTLSVKEKRKIILHIESIIKNVCQYHSKKEFIKDYGQMNIPKICGLLDKNRTIYMIDFFNLFEVSTIEFKTLANKK